MCLSVLPPGSTSQLLNHWQVEHPQLPLKDLIMMDTASTLFLQVNDIFRLAVVCASHDCDRVVYCIDQQR